MGCRWGIGGFERQIFIGLDSLLMKIVQSGVYASQSEAKKRTTVSCPSSSHLSLRESPYTFLP